MSVIQEALILYFSVNLLSATKKKLEEKVQALQEAMKASEQASSVSVSIFQTILYRYMCINSYQYLELYVMY